MRFRVLRCHDAPEFYRGMHRFSVGAEPDTPPPLIERAHSISMMGVAPTSQDWATFDHEQRRLGLRYELVALDDAPQGWRLLGLDVGEVSDIGWSAIANASVFLSDDERSALRGRLNADGLFSDRATADGFLALYLSRPDPDRDWEIGAFGELRMVYSVVEVYVPPWGT